MLAQLLVIGVNGAGKTTTLQILSGDVIPSQGTATLLGVDVLKNQSMARRLIGYCPQFDACTLQPRITSLEFCVSIRFSIDIFF